MKQLFWLIGVLLAVLTISQPVAYADEEIEYQDTDFIVKTVDRSLVRVGETITYTVTFMNPKLTPLTQLVITDYFDSRLDDLTVISDAPGNTLITGNIVITQDIDLAPGDSFSMVVQGRVSARAVSGNVITSGATLESPEASIHVSNRVETAVLPEALPSTGQLSRGAWLLWNMMPLVLLLSIAGFAAVSYRTYRRLHQSTVS